MAVVSNTEKIKGNGGKWPGGNRQHGHAKWCLTGITTNRGSQTANSNKSKIKELLDWFSVYQ
jgi:hypothetical protein